MQTAFSSGKLVLKYWSKSCGRNLVDQGQHGTVCNGLWQSDFIMMDNVTGAVYQMQLRFPSW